MLSNGDTQAPYLYRLSFSSTVNWRPIGLGWSALGFDITDTTEKNNWLATGPYDFS